MSIYIYPEALPDNPYSQGGNMTNPLREAFDGKSDSVREIKRYVRNSNSSYQYSGIQLRPVSTGGRNIVDGTDGYGWKLSAGDTQPSYAEWQTIDYGNTITFSGLYNIATYLPFWIRMEVPAGAEVRSHEDVVFRITATQILV